MIVRLLLVIGLLVTGLPPVRLVGAEPFTAALATPDFFGLVGRDPWYEFDEATNQPRRPFQEAMLRNIAASGAGWIRIEFHTNYLAGPFRAAGSIAFAETDLFVRELAPAAKVKVLGLLNSGIISDQPPLSYKIRDLLDPARRDRYIAAFVARSREIASRYSGQLGAYEIMNEPNINAELTTTTGGPNGPLRQEIPPDVYAELLTQTYRAIRSVDPGTPVLIGGLLKGQPVERPDRYTTNYLQAIYSSPAVVAFRATERRLPFDGVGLHPYPNTGLSRSLWLDDTLGLVDQMRTVVAANNDPGRLWITEVGVKASPASAMVAPATADETFQANWLRDLMTALATSYADRVARVFWFKYEDFPPGSPIETWGLVRLVERGGAYDPNGMIQRVKPAFTALHDLAFVSASSWLFAEGYTGAGFDQYLTIQNAGPTAALVAVTYLPTGAAPVMRSVVVPPRSRATLTVYDPVNGIGRGWPVATRLRASAPVVVERPLYFAYTPSRDAGGGAGPWTGGHVVLGAAEPSQRWYFAEGYTGAGFDQYLTLQNPSPISAGVTVTYLFADGSGSQTQRLTLPGASRQTVAVHSVVGRGRAVSMIIDSNPVGIVAERPIYFAYRSATQPGEVMTGGHVAMGVRQPAPSWWFAEGYTGAGFEQYFSILNPSSQVVTVTITYFLTGNRTLQRGLVVPGGRRATVAVHSAADPAGLGPGEANAARVDGSGPIVVERPIYFRYQLRDGRLVDGGHTVVGATALATRYQFAEGFTGAGFDQYLTLLNPATTTNRIQLIFQLADGSTVTRERTVLPGSRETIQVHDPLEGVGPNQAVSTTAVSLDGRAFLAERPMYFVYGPDWTGGHVTIGYPG